MSNGQFFSGNVIEKGLDILNIPGYAMAGLVDSTLSAEDPLDGLYRGVRNRKSFVDVLEKRNVPGATILGIAADVAAPTVPLAWITKLGKAQDIMRYKEASAEVFKATDSLSDNLKSAEDMFSKRIVDGGFSESSLKLFEDTAQVKKEAAESAFDFNSQALAAPAEQGATRFNLNRNMHQGDLSPMRDTMRAQAALRPQNFIEPVLKPDGSVSYKFNWKNFGSGLLGRGLEVIKNNVRSVNSALRKSPLFAGVGNVFADALQIQGEIGTSMRVAYLRRADDIARTLGDNADDHYWWARLSQDLGWEDVTAIGKDGQEVLVRRIDDIPEVLKRDPERLARIEKAVADTKKLMKEDFELKKSLGMRQIGTTQTQVVKRMSAQQLYQLDQLLKNPTQIKALIEQADNGLISLGDARMARFAQSILDEGGELDMFTRSITMELKEVENYLPAMHSQSGILKKELEARERYEKLVMEVEGIKGNMWDQLRKTDPARARELTKKYRTEIDAMVRAELDDPLEIIGGFQHSRRGNIKDAIIKRGDYINDPVELLYKWSHASSTAIGTAKGFGSRGEIFKAVRERYLQTHGYFDAMDLSGMDSLAKHGLDFLDRAYRVSTGTARSNFDGIVSRLGSMTDVMFLGPRTMLVQAMNLANSASHAGVGNALVSMAESMKDKEIRAVAERIGAVLPNMTTVYKSSSMFEKLMDKTMYMYKGIKKSDSLMRQQSAFAGFLDAAGRERKIVAALSKGNMDEAKRLVTQIKLDYNTDISYLLDGGRRIKDADLLRISQVASVKANFAQDVLNSSMYFNTPAGKLFGKFKSFAMHQTNFIWDHVRRIRTNPKDVHAYARLMRYAVTFPWIYQHLEKALKIFRSPEANKRDKDKSEEYVRNMLMTGALGFMGDAALALGSESEALSLGVITGPVPNAALRLKSMLWNLTPMSWNPEKAFSSSPNIFKQPVNAWTNLNPPNTPKFIPYATPSLPF